MLRLTSSVSLLAAAVSVVSLRAAAAQQGQCEVTPAVLQASERDTTSATTFEAAWRLVKMSYFDSLRVGTRFDSLYAALLPVDANTVTTRAELRALITKLLGSLGGSHLQVIPAAAMGGGAGSAPSVADIGAQLRVVAGEMLFFRVLPASAAGQHEIRAGWRLLAIDGCDISPAPPDMRAGVRVAERAMRRLKGADGSTVRIRVGDIQGRTHDLSLVRTMTATRTAALPNVPPEAGTVDTARVRTAKGATAGVVQLSTWHPTLAPALAAAMQAMQSSDGLVLDLRGNTGGVAQMFPWLAGFVLPPGTALGLFRFRDRVQPLCAAPQAGSFYAGPVAVLVDAHSHSTSEMFAASLQSLGRARVFGDTTFGGVVGAQYDRLPNGDILEHAVVDFETSTGDHAEGRGVIPDQVVPLRVDDLRRGTDRVQLAALEWIDAERNRPEDAKRPSLTALAKCPL